MTPEQTRIRARLGASLRHRPDDVAAADALRRELKASKAEDYIKRLVDVPPTLTAEQRDGLVSLLRGAA